MNPRVVSALGLLSCTAFLIGNIWYDLADNPTMDCPQDPGAANPNIFFMPLFFMVAILVWGCYQSFKTLGKYHRFVWFFYLVLSISQVIKNFFTPTIQTWNDYVFFIVAIINLIYNLIKYRKVET